MPVLPSQDVTEIRGEEWENDIRRTNRLVQYFESIHTLALADHAYGKSEVAHEVQNLNENEIF